MTFICFIATLENSQNRGYAWCQLAYEDNQGAGSKGREFRIPEMEMEME